MRDDHCTSCWNTMFPSPPISWGGSPRNFLCGDCDSELIEEAGLVWDENSDEWSYHPSTRCPFCGSPFTYTDGNELHHYGCGTSLWYDGDSRIIDARIETEVLCGEGIRQAHRENR